MACAVRALSPEIIATFKPNPCKASIAARELGLTGSATAMTAARRPSMAADIGDVPSPPGRAAVAANEALAKECR